MQHFYLRSSLDGWFDLSGEVTLWTLLKENVKTSKHELDMSAMGWIMSLQNLCYVEVLTPLPVSVTLFGNKNLHM